MFKRTLEITSVPAQSAAPPSSKDQNCKDKYPFLKYKIFKQVSLIFVWMCLGLFLEIVGPTLIDLRDKINVDLEQISRALIATSVGITAGSLIGGFLHERFYRFTELIIVLALGLATVSTISMPNVGTLSLVALCMFCNGVAEGLLNTGGNTMVMHMWGEKAAAPMHSLHFGFGVGAILGPQLANPFLAARNVNNTGSNTTISTPANESRIEYAYLIAGIIVFCCGLLWLFIYIKGYPKGFPRRQGTASLTADMFSPSSCARGDFIFGLMIFVTLFFLFIQATGGQRAYGRFLYAFLVESDLKFQKDPATDLISLFWLSFTLGRATGIPISHFVSTPLMIAVQSVSLLIISVIMAVTVFKSHLIIWIFSFPMGYFMAQVFPSGMAWSNIYLDMNSVGVMVLLMGASAGGVIYQYLPGYLLNKYGQEALMYIMVTYSGCLVLAITVLTVLAKLYTKRNPRNQEIEETVVEVYTMNDRTEDNIKESPNL